MEQLCGDYPEKIFLIREGDDTKYIDDPAWDDQRHFPHDIEYIRSGKLISLRLHIAALYTERDVALAHSAELQDQLLRSLAVLEPMGRLSTMWQSPLNLQEMRRIRSLTKEIKELIRKISSP